MKFWSRENRRQIRRKLLAPFKPLEYKVRSFAQKFILKTIDKHGFKPANPGLAADSLQNTLLLPLLQSKRSPESQRTTERNALAIGGYLLTGHPRVDYFYHDPKDLVETPRMLCGNYQPNVTAWICANVVPDARILVVGGGQGYHLLSLLGKLGRSGKVLVLNSRSDERTMIDLNLRVNRLEDRVQIKAVKLRELETPGRALRRQVNSFNPTMTFVDLQSDSSVPVSAMKSWGLEHVFQINDHEVVAMKQQRLIGNSALRKAA